MPLYFRTTLISLFFLEPFPSGIGAANKVNQGQVNNKQNARLRSTPFLESDSTIATSTNNNPILPTTGLIGDPDESLVAEAVRQKNNLIKYWSPEQGYQIIPWSQRNRLDPNEQGVNYFIMAVTVLAQFEPRNSFPSQPTNYATIVRSIVDNHLPQNQPVFKVFVGSETATRKLVNNKGFLLGFNTDTFLWTPEKLEHDVILQQAAKHHEFRKTPYVAIHIDNGPYIAGSLPHIRKLFAGKTDYVVERVILRSKGTNTGAHLGDASSNRNWAHWLSSARTVAQGIFSWSPPKQNKLFIQSTNRAAQFQVDNDSSVEIKTSSMVTWKTLPSNEELLKQREQWNINVFLVQVEQGYFLIPNIELKYLQEFADEKPQIHTLLLSQAAAPHLESIYTAQTLLKNENLNCESVRVLASEGVELAYSPQCSLVVTDSGWELAQANEQKQLAIAQNIAQPIIVFRPDGKPASAVYLKALSDTVQSSIESLQVSTLVPVYRLEDLDAEERESGIGISITDAIQRTLQFFPKQREFEVLMPDGQHVKYSVTPPKSFLSRHDYDAINVVVPVEGQPITFYSFGER